MTTISPPEACHITQVKPKVIHILEDAPTMYITHPYYETAPPEMQVVGLRVLEQMAGNDYILLSTRQVNNILWYTLLLSPPIRIAAPRGVPDFYKYFELDSVYTRVTDSGYMEAR